MATAVFCISCDGGYEKNSIEEFKQQVKGQAQGTTYQIVYYDLQERNFKPQFDSILQAIDQSMSTYIDGSIIDRWNKSDSGIIVDQLFLDVLTVSRKIYEFSDGAFDPTIMPVVKYWGFGPERYVHPEKVDSTEIDSLLKFVDFDTLRVYKDNRLISWNDLIYTDKIKAPVFLQKPMPEMQLDFNAVAQGWSVDLLSSFLDDKKIRSYFVELGGEIRAGFPKPEGELWKFGIDKPIENLSERELEAIVNLRNKGLATSGSYRKFYEKDGIKYSHTIDPKTGFPVTHTLLSSTVIAKTAGEADAMATAFMVMGTDSARQYLINKKLLGEEAFLIYDYGGVFETFATPGIEKLITQIE